MPQANEQVQAGGAKHVAREYSVTSVEKIDPPEGGEAGNWYRYVVENARSTITGCRRGSLQQVTRHAKSFAEELNARAGGRVASPWAPRQKK